MTVYELERQGVRSVRYEADAQRLFIEFFRGATYVYEAVPENIVAWLVRTKDVAGYIQRVITPRFAYRKWTADPGANGTGRADSAGADLEAQLRASLNAASFKASRSPKTP